ncbi:MAG: RNA polymerase sigma factor [Bauldia sp.]|nr:RNA polymerase sigma factor [Bauldia sp.]
MTSIGPDLIALLPRLRRYAVALCRTADVADELVQTACERALAGVAGLRAELPFEAWMFRIVRNLWYDRLRRLRTRGKELDITARDDLVSVDGERHPERRLLLRRVLLAIDGLPEEQRELMLLVCVEDVSYRDAATTLGLPIGTVMSRLARARKRIADELGIESGRLL